MKDSTKPKSGSCTHLFYSPPCIIRLHPVNLFLGTHSSSLTLPNHLQHTMSRKKDNGDGGQMKVVVCNLYMCFMIRVVSVHSGCICNMCRAF